jgi:hypothetical protein
LLLRESDAHERWLAVCQARRDTNRDGKVAVRNAGFHGELEGDAFELYLVLGGGAGTRIDALASASEDGRWLAIVRDRNVDLVDAQNGDTFRLRDADAEPDHFPGDRHRAARFARNRLLFIRRAGNASKLVVYDPATHGEREIAVPGRLWRIGRHRDRFVRVFTVEAGAPFPSVETNLEAGECAGFAMSYSTSGAQGEPTERWIDLDTGNEVSEEAVPKPVGLVCDNTGACSATPAQVPIQLGTEDLIEYAWGSKIYVERFAPEGGPPREKVVIDVATGDRKPIAIKVLMDGADQYVIDGRGQVFDLETARHIGTDDMALRVSATGRVLRVSGRPNESFLDTISYGPLTWRPAGARRAP